MKKWTMFALVLMFAVAIAIPVDQTKNAETVEPRPTSAPIWNV
jgi:hypothetical protein